MTVSQEAVRPPDTEIGTGGDGTPKHSERASRSLGPMVKYAFLGLSLVIVLLPMYVLVVTSFKTPEESSVQNMWSLPTALDIGAWSRAWEALSPSLGRSIVMAVGSAVLVAIVGALNGYVLSLVRFRGDNTVFGAILFGMFIPYQAVMVPLRDVVNAIGLPPGIPTLIVVHSIYGIPIGTLILRNYYVNTVPGSLVEAAAIDGASVWRTFRSIVLPLSPPALVVTVIWQFTQVWNDFLFAVFMTNTRNGPVMLQLSALAGAQSPDYAQSMAGALLASAPALLVYILLGKYFVSGLMAGSVKS
jgi:glucose/mannose transport system permease protein